MKTFWLTLILFVVPLLVSATQEEINELGQRMTKFNVETSRTNFDRIQDLMKSNLAYIEKQDAGTNALRTAVFLARVHQKYGWPIADIGAFDDLAHEVIKGSSELARYANSDALIDPVKLDIWWWSFFATGDEIYLTKLMNQTGSLDDIDPHSSSDIATFRRKVVLMSVANWSVKSNCQNYPSVLKFFTKASEKEKDAARRKFLEECIRSAEGK